MADHGAKAPESSVDVVAAAARELSARLPAGWRFSSAEDLRHTHGRTDAIFAITSPNDEVATIVVEALRTVTPRDVPGLRETLSSLSSIHGASEGLVASRYLSMPVRERLRKAGLSYIDATGNILVESRSPGLFISDRGADRDPWRGPGRPRGTLKGEPAAKVVRALLDLPGPWKVRRLASVSKASIGSVYRVLEFLETEGLASRDGDGLVTVPDWTPILRRWSKDYQLLHTNTVSRWIAPRGLPDLLDRVRAYDDVEYAMTGTIAATHWHTYAPARSAMVYVADPDLAAATWQLRATETGANVLLIQPAYDVVVERTVRSSDGLRVAAPTQVVADLMTGPGRAPAEGEALLEWMEQHEHLWRSNRSDADDSKSAS